MEIIPFSIIPKYLNFQKASSGQLNQKIKDLTVTNVKLRQEKEKTDEAIEKLNNDFVELTAANEKLRKECAQLTHSV